MIICNNYIQKHKLFTFKLQSITKMDVLIIALTALLGSALTFFSGFGLGTILVPVFALFFPIDLAIAMTAIVHFLNNLFKLVLVGKGANKEVVIKFGIPSLLASFLGAFVLTRLAANFGTIEFSMGSANYSTTALKISIGAILFFFALVELLPDLNRLQFNQRYFMLGGALSGFFGGLSGNQGALRSMFLIKANLSKESFIATGVVIACMVDVARLSIYSNKLFSLQLSLPYYTILIACLSAFIGAYFGNKLIKKVTLKLVQGIVAVALMTFSILLLFGVL